MRVRQLRAGGRINPLQVFVLAIAAAVAYAGYVYMPGQMRKMSMNGLARDMSHKMLVDFNDGQIREEIINRAQHQGVMGLGASGITLERLQPLKCRVTLTWVEQPHPFWNKNQVLHMKVVQEAEPGGNLLKNAT